MTEGIELKDFVQSVIKQIEEGIDNSKRTLNDGIELELSVTETVKGEGGLKVYVAQGGVSKSVEKLHKIKFTVYPNYNFPKQDLHVNALPWSGYEF